MIRDQRVKTLWKAGFENGTRKELAFLFDGFFIFLSTETFRKGMPGQGWLDTYVTTTLTKRTALAGWVPAVLNMSNEEFVPRLYHVILRLSY